MTQSMYAAPRTRTMATAREAIVLRRHKEYAPNNAKIAIAIAKIIPAFYPISLRERRFGRPDQRARVIKRLSS